MTFDDRGAAAEPDRCAVLLCCSPMKLSAASTYAFYGLAYLAAQPQDRFVPLSEITRCYDVPEKHLAKIFQQLVKARILQSARGVSGGFALSRSPDRISVLDVIEIIEGPIEQTGCLLLEKGCDRDGTCKINAVWTRAQQAMLTILRTSTVADFVEKVPSLVNLSRRRR
jgi:Rrf2 family protein